MAKNKKNNGVVPVSPVSQENVMSEATVVKVRKRAPMVSDKDFLTAHAHSSSVKELAEKVGMTEGSTFARLTRLRSQGVPLKKFKRVRAKRFTVEYIESLKALYANQLQDAQTEETETESTV